MNSMVSPVKTPIPIPTKRPIVTPETEPQRVLPPEPLCPAQKERITRRIKEPFIQYDRN